MRLAMPLVSGLMVAVMAIAIELPSFSARWWMFILAANAVLAMRAWAW